LTSSWQRSIEHSVTAACRASAAVFISITLSLSHVFILTTFPLL